jgi:ribosomal protein L35
MNTVVLQGRVTYARGLPIVPTDEKDGRVFFRVLYVEAGSKSTMFRCKTMIFSSEMASSIEAPQWTDGSFRFEMIVPEDENGQKSISGEILIAVYRSRWQGGNTFIGQASFDLRDIVSLYGGEAGDVEQRVIEGPYDLIDRQGRVAGDASEVGLSLNFMWRVPESPAPAPRRPPAVASIVDPEEIPAPVSPRRSKSAASKRPNATASQRIHSAQAFRRKAMADKIEAENRAMQARIIKKGAQATKERTMDLYTNKATVQIGVTSKSKSGSVAQKTPEEMLNILNTLKLNAASALKDGTLLKAVLQKERSTNKKMESEIARMLAIETSSAGSWEATGITPSDRALDPLKVELDRNSDGELRDLLGEHIALQETRRHLIARAKKATAQGNEIQARIDALNEQMSMAWELVESDAMGGDSAAWETPLAEAALVAKEIRLLESDIIALEGNGSILQQTPAAEELNGERIMNEALKRQLLRLNERLDGAKYDRDIMQDRIKAIRDEDQVGRLRTAVSTLRAALYRCERRARAEAVAALSEDIASGVNIR